ncbi:MAG: hypothetical protein ACO1SV_21820 [Fimbriimonas sp.]
MITLALLIVVSVLLLVSVWINGSLRRELTLRTDRRTQQTIDRELLVDSLREEVKALRARVMIQEVFGGRRDA